MLSEVRTILIFFHTIFIFTSDTGTFYIYTTAIFTTVMFTSAIFTYGLHKYQPFKLLQFYL